MPQPAHKIRRGVLSVTIWRNTNPDKGTVWYSVDPIRGYKQADDIWQETNSLGLDDLLPMGKLLDQADSWIVAAQKADANARKASQGAGSGGK